MLLIPLLVAAIALLTSSLTASEFTRCAPQHTPQRYYDGLARVIALEESLVSHKGASGVDEVHALDEDSPRIAIDVNFHVMFDWELDGITYNTYLKQFSILKEFYEPLGFDFTLLMTYEYHQPHYARGYSQRQMKRDFHRGSYSTLNVYFVDRIRRSMEIFGRGTLPLPDMRSDDRFFLEDGVLISIRALPGFSTFSEYDAEEGKTLLHETGHWLGLEHIDYQGCDPDLVNGGDFVADTPPQAYGFYECFPSGTVIHSCPKETFPDQNLITNIMDRIPDRCMESFTPGQVARMKNMYWLMRHNKPLPPSTPEDPVPSAAAEPDPEDEE
ncbi:hypothetical protein BKA80DRAFT_263272 [Phyllosticta citrichinensis]